MYDFLIGPMLALSLIIFIGGMAYRVRQFFSLTESVPIDPSALPKPLTDAVAQRETNEYLRIDSATDILLKWQLRLKRTLMGRSPLFVLTTTLFHTLLFLLPIVAVGHSVLLDDYFGFGLPTLSETTVDNLTLLFCGLFFFFVFRRIIVPKVRSVTTYRDWLALLITGAPFITGWMAFHQVFDYQILLYLHIIAGELMLIAIPFTKLVHMPFFVLSRFWIRNELSLANGSRKWVENN